MRMPSSDTVNTSKSPVTTINYDKMYSIIGDQALRKACQFGVLNVIALQEDKS